MIASFREARIRQAQYRTAAARARRRKAARDGDAELRRALGRVEFGDYCPICRDYPCRCGRGG